MKPFSYKSSDWHDLRARALVAARWRCRFCGASVRAKGAARVDHILTVREHPELAMVLANLRVLCVACDAKRHADKGGHQTPRTPIGLDGFPL